MDKMLAAQTVSPDARVEVERLEREALILVIEDEVRLSNALRNICDCLHVAIERVPTRDDVAMALHRRGKG